MKEIERKFLVKPSLKNLLRHFVPDDIQQGYLPTTSAVAVRVRIKNSKGYLTVKGPTIGLSRSEFEYEIPVDEAQAMMLLCGDQVLNKKRFTLVWQEKTWEIDVFEGRHAGLILAEIELTSEEEKVELPDWVLEEVSHDPRFYNQNLVQSAHSILH